MKKDGIAIISEDIMGIIRGITETAQELLADEFDDISEALSLAGADPLDITIKARLTRYPSSTRLDCDLSFMKGQKIKASANKVIDDKQLSFPEV